MFSLLDKQRMSWWANLPDYVARVGIYRDFNALYFSDCRPGAWRAC